MASTSVTYSPPIRRPGRAARPDYEQLEQAQALAEQGNIREAIAKTFAPMPAAEMEKLEAMTAGIVPDALWFRKDAAPAKEPENDQNTD